MPEHIVVQEPDHVIPVALEMFRACCVVDLSISVAFTVELNNQSRLMTEEIGNEWWHGVLPAEFETVELSIAQTGP